MIQKISIKDFASFDSVGIEIDNLKKINVIYGSNGTGKSTISKFLAHTEDFPRCHIDWNDETPMKILAYNKEFCEKNYTEQIPGVFTLGEASGDIMSVISKKKTELDDIKALGENYKNEIKKLEDANNAEDESFRVASWNDLLKNYESYFSKSSIGAGTKDAFLSKLMNAYDNKFDSSLSFENLKEKAILLFGAQPTRQDKLSSFSFANGIAIESDDIWNKAIVGKQDIDIASLIMRLGSIDWVSQGVSYIEEGSDICPFCQQHTITKDFKEKINLFFDDSYKEDINKLESFIHEYAELSSSLLQGIEETISEQKSKEKTFLDISSIESTLSKLKLAFDGNIELMHSKKKEPSRKLLLTNTADIIDTINVLIKDANIRIAEINRLADNYAKERNKLIKDIWNFFATSYSATIDAHIKKINGYNKAVKNLQNKRAEVLNRCNAVNNELVELENSVTSVTPTVNEINRLLIGYGFTNFQIQEVQDKKNHYQIVREDGEPALHTLSEGERTFITFLYYMQLVKGSHNPDGVTSNRVLVIDDPVSSLDSNVLFVVSTLLRDVFTDIYEGKGSAKQVILLTHNVYFHKEIAFQDKHCKWRNCINHWILRKRNNVSSVQAYGNKSPIKSSYELLWTELKNDSSNSYIVIQNIMRRIIENYFQVFGGYSPEGILEKFSVAEDKQICRSLLSWVNDGSHSLQEDIFIEMSEDQLSRYKDIFHRIFTFMGHEAHYNMMMGMEDKEDESVANS